MRIAFSGAAGTGKSHLAKIVAEWLSLPMCPVGSRTVCKEMGFEHAYDVDKAGMRPEFQKRLCRAKREWEADTAAFVTDRSHLDNLAYTSLHSIDTVGVEFLQTILRANACYTHIIHIDARAEDAFMNLDDPARHQSRIYHRHFAMLLAALWTYYVAEGQQILWVTSPDLSYREKQVFQFLERR